MALLDADEPLAWTVDNACGAGNAVVVCDHASNRIPRCLDGLGLNATELTGHIAWDAGAADVARRLAALLDAPSVASGYSRLVVDCNRPLASKESMPTCSDGVVIPGNRSINAADREVRAAALFRPYHRAIAGVLDRRVAAGRPSLLLSIHSFAPVLNDRRRPWQIGFAYGRDSRLALLLLDAFERDGRVVVGHNQPYRVEDAFDYTIPVHGEQREVPHVLIEIRQDLLTTSERCAEWAARLAEAYRGSEPSLVS